MVTAGWRSSRTVTKFKKNTFQYTRHPVRSSQLPAASHKPPVPEAAGAGPHGCGSSAVVTRNALSAEMFGQEVQLIRCGLEGQLMELLL